MIDRIQWLGHGSFRIEGPPLIYINPWRVVRTAFHADLILIGHDHYEHFSLADIEKLRGPDTVIISNEKVAAQLPDCIVLRPWQSYTLDRARVTAVPAYSPGDLRHAESDGGLGFIISVNFYDIYYAGDTHVIPEMERISPDVAILPIDGTGTLNVNDAASVVKKMRPRYVYPCNWGAGTFGATPQDAQEFKQQVGGRSEVILPMLTR
jgi:L-ascorbate metabolism protein UlaG (beta-lactamase superfamily)